MRLGTGTQLASVAVAMAFAGCSTVQGLWRGELRPGRKQLLAASWYGPELHGRRTASGAAFDTRAMTAAHRTLPFGTRLRVRNPQNERTVVVSVTDRGPWVRGRDLDLSFAAARRLGFVGQGVTEVEVEVLGDTPRDPALGRPATDRAPSVSRGDDLRR